MANDALSALLDGECSGPELDRLLDELEQDSAVGERWSRLCAAREAEAGVRIGLQQPCICAGVMAALDDQPEAPGAKVVDLAVHRAGIKPRPRVLRYWKPAVGFAAAASMGAAAVLLVQPQVEEPDYRISANAEQVAYEPGSAEAQYAEQLRGYMIDHSNSTGGGVGGTLSYARFAAHPAVYRPGSEGRP